MRKVHIDHLAQGDRLARAVYSSDGRILLSEGIEVREGFMVKLRAMGISEVYIEDDMSQGIAAQDVIQEKTRCEALVTAKSFIEKHSFLDNMNTGKVRELIDKMIDELLSNEEILVNLASIKSVDDYTFEHSVNVCILSLITGIGLGYNAPRLKDLGIGALLHDIGKMKISGEILKKPSQLTVEEFEEIKKHTVYGYEILKNNSKVSMISAFIAFGHHERYDGSGYPLNLRGENIHQCARIVAVADVYDALTSDRVYRKKLRPHEVIEYITSLGSHHFEQEIVESFVKYIALYPVGSGVVLNTREKALVVKANRNVPTRPVVRIVMDRDGTWLKGYYEIDLTKKTGLYITDACEIEATGNRQWAMGREEDEI
jgi:HD-GYP domain-containing protein (c-di-GMP phosphodiesterase class II)